MSGNLRLAGFAALVVALAAALGLSVLDRPGYGTSGPVALHTTAPPPPSSPPPLLPPDDPAVVYLPRIPKFQHVPPPAHPMGPLDGPQVWVHRVPTDQPVAFITIDDGWTKHPMAASLIKAANVPVTLFLAVNAIKDDPGYFRGLQDAGAVIEAHTLTHPELKGRPAASQRHEICGSADRLAEWYGKRPVLFRPPFGDKDATTLAVTRECGLRAAVFWTETVDKGVVRYQTDQQVHAGDIILMHFRPAFPDDFLAALNAIHDAGLTPALLEDYIA